MFLNRIMTGFKIVKESFVFLWQHKILSLYMTAATFLFALIQYLLSYNFTFTIKESDKITEFVSQGGIWSNTISKDFVLLLFKSSSSLLYIFSLASIFTFIMIFFAILLIKHVLQIKEHRNFDFYFISEKLSTIIAWMLFVSVLHMFKILAELHYWSPLYSDLILVGVALFISLFMIFVLPIIADTSLNIFKAMRLSLKIFAKSWIELIIALIILVFIWGLLAYPLMYFIVNHSNANLVIISIAWIPVIIGLTITDIMKTLLYAKFYKQSTD